MTNSSNEKNTQFYGQVQSILSELNSKYIYILMGDFNAKVGSDNTRYKEVIGKHGLGEMSENRKLFADTCALFAIGGTIYVHRDIHKGTWV